MEKAEALKVAREFVERHTIPARERFQRDQFADMLADLSARAVDLTLERNESNYELRDRLDQCDEILRGIQSALKTIEDLYGSRSDRSELPDEERERLLRDEEEENRILWRRRDPKISFHEGTDSDHHYTPDRDSLIYEAAGYLEQSWMSHPVLDYVLIDALVTNELCAFGEALKRDLMRFPRDQIGMNKVYYENKGNLKKMGSFNSGDAWDRLAKWALLLVVIPVISLLFARQGFDFGGMALWIWAWGLAAYIGYKLLIWTIRRLSRQEPDLETRSLKLWDKMYEVWRMLEGPVINPTMLRDELMKTREAGAVWDPPIYALVDRAIARDPTAWTTLLPRIELHHRFARSQRG